MGEARPLLSSLPLLSCPCCGGPAWRGDWDHPAAGRTFYSVSCSVCGLTTCGRGSPEEAARTWNRRTPWPVYCQHPACVAALADELAARGLTVEAVELHKDPAAAQVPCLHGPAGPAEST